MFIKQITIEGVDGDVEIRRSDSGATVAANGVEHEYFAKIANDDDLHSIAWNAAKVICGETRGGKPNATGSMINDIAQEIQRVAGY
ncbi:MAG: hypothetical protein KF757_09050 [Phycisphaeraceae bacterium]|nr:hypothetical protein [Phycisphaeraceae bacterium]MCW5762901.1 hypothetical protein [Phycisphaeraceae bacterium]